MKHVKETIKKDFSLGKFSLYAGLCLMAVFVVYKLTLPLVYESVPSSVHETKIFVIISFLVLCCSIIAIMKKHSYAIVSLLVNLLFFLLFFVGKIFYAINNKVSFPENDDCLEAHPVRNTIIQACEKEDDSFPLSDLIESILMFFS